jgi:hypothetical protein
VKRWRRIGGRIGLVVACALLAWSLPASAQSLEAEAQIGSPGKIPRWPGALHGGVSGIDAWLPFRAVVRNASSTALNGRLVLEETGVDRRPRILGERPLSLAPGATKRVGWPVLFDGDASYALRYLEETHGELPVQGADVLLPESRGQNEPLVLVARRPGRTRPLESLQPRPDHNGLREWVLVETRPEHLPEDGAAYHRLDLLMLDDIPLGELSADQRAAILEFVAGGGLLWVSMKTRLASGDGGDLAAALPGRPQGVATLTRVPSLAALTGSALPLRRPGTFLTFQPTPEATTWGEAPAVVLHRDFGRGLIAQGGFDLEATGLEEPQLLLYELLTARPRPPSLLPSAFEPSLVRRLEASLRGATRKPLPPARQVGILVVIYLLVVGVLPYLVFRRSGRLEYAWLGVVGGAVLGAFGVAGLSERYAQDSLAARVGLVEASDATAGHRRLSHWAVFSRPGGDLTVPLAGPSAPFPAPKEATLRWTGAREVTLATHPQDSTLLTTTEPVTLPQGLRFKVPPRGPASLEASAGLDRLLGGWAFDAQGRPLELRLPTGTLERDPEHLGPALEVLRQHASELAERRGRPFALVRYEGPAAAAEGFPERSLDVLLLEAHGGTPPAGRELALTCRTHALPVDPASDKMEFRFWGPRPWDPAAAAARIRWRQGRWRWGRSRVPPTEVWFHAEGRWVGSRANAWQHGIVRVSPLGIARGRVRMDRYQGLRPEVTVRFRRRSR